MMYQLDNYYMSLHKELPSTNVLVYKQRNGVEMLTKRYPIGMTSARRVWLSLICKLIRPMTIQYKLRRFQSLYVLGAVKE